MSQRSVFVRRQVLSLVCCLSLLAFCNVGTASAEDEEPSVEMNVSMLLSDQPGTVCLSMKNLGKADYATSVAGSNYSRFVVQFEGKVYEDYVWAEMIKPIVIGPGETKVWKINMLTHFRVNHWLRAGLYQFKWVVVQPGNKDKVKFSSNELLIVRDKDEEEGGNK